MAVAGDTLSSISLAAGLELSQLQAANPSNASVVCGEELTIPCNASRDAASCPFRGRARLALLPCTRLSQALASRKLWYREVSILSPIYLDTLRSTAAAYAITAATSVECIAGRPPSLHNTAADYFGDAGASFGPRSALSTEPYMIRRRDSRAKLVPVVSLDTIQGLVSFSSPDARYRAA